MATPNSRLCMARRPRSQPRQPFAHPPSAEAARTRAKPANPAACCAETHPSTPSSPCPIRTHTFSKVNESGCTLRTEFLLSLSPVSFSCTWFIAVGMLVDITHRHYYLYNGWIIEYINNMTCFLSQGSRYWRLTEKGVDSGYPKSISQDWDGLPSNIDAAFTWTNGKTYFFRVRRCRCAL